MLRTPGHSWAPISPGKQGEPKSERVTTIPHLVHREAVFAVAALAVLLVWSMLVPAPLDGVADPMHSPNPAKAPWYFLGIQELLLHFHPLVGAVIIPSLAIGALVLLPFRALISQRPFLVLPANVVG